MSAVVSKISEMLEMTVPPNGGISYRRTTGKHDATASSSSLFLFLLLLLLFLACNQEPPVPHRAFYFFLWWREERRSPQSRKEVLMECRQLDLPSYSWLAWEGGREGRGYLVDYLWDGRVTCC